MKKIPVRYYCALIPLVFFGLHAAVCAYRYVNDVPSGDNPYRRPEWLMYLTSTSFVVGAAISGVMLAVMGIADISEWVEKRSEEHRTRKLMGN